MEFEYDGGPPYRGRDWGGVALTPLAPSPTSPLSRRRTSAVPPPPPGPPPKAPIPNLPLLDTHYEMDDEMLGVSDPMFDIPTMSSPYSRPAPSPGLAAVTAFSQARFASTSNSYSSHSPGTSPIEPLSDSPPRSMLRAGVSQPTATAHESVPDRHTLHPPDQQRSTHQRPSSRRALTKALELAREAVKLDSTNDDPYGAVMAYSKSVSLLSEVMARVMRGEDSTESSRRRSGRRRSVVAQEEEVRRLKSIVSRAPLALRLQSEPFALCNHTV